MLYLPLILWASVLPARALGGLTHCEISTQAWSASIAGHVMQHADRCVLSSFVNDSEIWWLAGDAEALQALLSWLQATTYATDGRSRLEIVLHEGTPVVEALGEAHPGLSADWRLTLSGERRRKRRRGPMDTIAWARLDVWLGGRIAPDRLRIPDGIPTAWSPTDLLRRANTP